MSTGAAKETGIQHSLAAILCSRPQPQGAVATRRTLAARRSALAMYSPSVSRIGALVLASRPAVSGPALSSALPLGPRYNRESVPEPTKVSSASSAAVTSKTADPETRANTT